MDQVNHSKRMSFFAIFCACIFSSNAMAACCIVVNNQSDYNSQIPLTTQVTITNPTLDNQPTNIYTATIAPGKSSNINLANTQGSSGAPINQPNSQLVVEISVLSNGSQVEYQKWFTSNTGQNPSLKECASTSNCCGNSTIIQESSSGDGGTAFTIAYNPQISGKCGGKASATNTE